MTATLTTKKPVPPAQPEDLRWLIKDHNMAMRALNNAIRYGHQIGISAETLADLAADVRAARALIREWYAHPNGIEYAAVVARYNAEAAEWNAALERAKQARRNAVEVAKVRTAACPRCFATHAGEC